MAGFCKQAVSYKQLCTKNILIWSGQCSICFNTDEAIMGPSEVQCYQTAAMRGGGGECCCQVWAWNSAQMMSFFSITHRTFLFSEGGQVTQAEQVRW